MRLCLCVLCTVSVLLSVRTLTGSRGDMNLNIPSVDKERLLAHLDHNNPNTFEVEDLTRLIKQVCIILHYSLRTFFCFIHYQ